MGYVVAVAGIAGAGKSTLVRELVAVLGDATSIHIDRYQRITSRPLREIVAWMERGGDFDEFDIPLVGDHLAKLKNGEGVVDPVNMHPMPARKYVIFETHFGRLHRDTGRHIDLLVWIDTPREIALARNLRDLIRPLFEDPGMKLTRDQVRGLYDYLGSYLADVRRLVLMQQQRIAKDADLVVDGSAISADVVEQVRQYVLARLA